MNAQHYQEIKRLFKEAVNLPPEKRSAFLDTECGDDHELRAKVERLFGADSHSGDILEPLIQLNDPCPRPGESLVDTRIGQYLLMRVISSGGMGTVYEAQQEHPRRTVAVKVLRAGIASKSALRRFEYEAQIMASLRHPGIAQLFEAGTHGEEGSIPYFVMEYIPEARTITDYALEKKLATAERLHLFMQVCEAVRHGHQKGIIHRDLKPGNILVDVEGHVKIIDFGIARATDSDVALTTTQTEMGQLLGTVQYMSPEQCDANPHDLDTRSDIYSLGVVLYELLCRKLPFDVIRKPIYDATRVIREQPPGKPSTTNRSLKGDVETIVLKALEKDRSRRYPSIEDLRRDIDHYLKGELITARPPSAAYQFKSFVRRHKALVTGVAAVFVVLLAGFITSTSLYFRATREAESSSRINAFYNGMIKGLFSTKSVYRSLEMAVEDAPESVSTDEYPEDISITRMLRGSSPEISEAFIGKPLEEARIREAFGHALYGLGYYEDAVDMLKDALDFSCKELGDHHSLTVLIRHRLGVLLRDSAKFNEAVPLQRQALDGMSKVYGADHPYTLACRKSLAHTLRFLRIFEESNELFRNTLAAQQRVLGKDHRQTLSTMLMWSQSFGKQLALREGLPLVREANKILTEKCDPDLRQKIESDLMLGRFHVLECKYNQAETLLRSAVDQARIIYKDHPKTYLFTKNLLEAMTGENAFEEREQLFQETLQGYRKWRGEGISDTLAVIDNHIGFLASRGRFDEVLVLKRERLERCVDELGEQHPRTIEACEQLVNVLLSLGQPSEGEERLRQWIDMNTRARGEGARQTLNARLTAALILDQAGKGDEARRHVEKAMAAWRERIGRPEATAQDFNDCAWLLLTCEPVDLRDPAQALGLVQTAVALSHGKNPNFLDTLARAYHLTGDHEKAVETQEKALAAVPEGFWQNLWQLENSMIDFLLGRGGLEEAGPFIRRLEADFKEKYGDSDYYMGMRLFPKVLVLVDNGHYVFAEPLTRRCVELLGKGKWGSGAWEVKLCHAMLGRCLAGLERFDEAELHLLEGCKGLKGNPLASLEYQQKAMDWIVLLYEDWGKSDKAEEWRTR